MSSSLGFSGTLLIPSPPTLVLSTSSVVGFLSSSPGAPGLFKVSKPIFEVSAVSVCGLFSRVDPPTFVVSAVSVRGFLSSSVGSPFFTTFPLRTLGSSSWGSSSSFFLFCKFITLFFIIFFLFVFIISSISFSGNCLYFHVLKYLTKRLLGMFSIKFLINCFLSSSLGTFGDLLMLEPATFVGSTSSVFGNLSSSPGFSGSPGFLFFIIFPLRFIIFFPSGPSTSSYSSSSSPGSSGSPGFLYFIIFPLRLIIFSPSGPSISSYSSSSSGLT